MARQLIGTGLLPSQYNRTALAVRFNQHTGIQRNVAQEMSRNCMHAMLSRTLSVLMDAARMTNTNKFGGYTAASLTVLATVMN